MAEYSSTEKPEEQPSGLRRSPFYVTEIPKFDLDSYISNYEGFTRLDRLIAIGTSSEFLAKDALKSALHEAEQGKNVKRYLDIAEYLQTTFPNEPGTNIGRTWAEHTSKQINAESERLEQELKGYKNNLIKESIRKGQEDLGAHYFATGDLSAAYRAYSRMREYCTTPKHITEMNLHLALIAVASQNWMSLNTSVLRIQNQNPQTQTQTQTGATSSSQTSSKPDDVAKLSPTLTPLLGLASLKTNDYRTAASHLLRTPSAFLSLEPVTASNINISKSVLTPNDVAVYGGLCALATFSRSELASSFVLESPSFRQFLELEPHVRRAIGCFVGGKYKDSLALLESYRADWTLDIWLQKHVDPLLGMIRQKMMVSFVEPFSRLDVSAIRETFGPSGVRRSNGGVNGVRNSEMTTTNGDDQGAELDDISQELVHLISNRTLLNVRLDLMSGLLVAAPPHLSSDQQDDNKPPNAAASSTSTDRHAVMNRAVRVAEEQEKSLRIKLARTGMMEAGFEIKGSPSGSGGGHYGKAPMGSGPTGGITPDERADGRLRYEDPVPPPGLDHFGNSDVSMEGMDE